jgi:hypothetical protein
MFGSVELLSDSPFGVWLRQHEIDVPYYTLSYYFVLAPGAEE